MMTDLERLVVSGTEGYLSVFEHFRSKNKEGKGAEAFEATEELYHSITNRYRFERSGYQGFQVMKCRIIKRRIKQKRK
jgi:hypothetical protein